MLTRISPAQPSRRWASAQGSGEDIQSSRWESGSSAREMRGYGWRREEGKGNRGGRLTALRSEDCASRLNEACQLLQQAIHLGVGADGNAKAVAVPDEVHVTDQDHAPLQLFVDRLHGPVSAAAPEEVGLAGADVEAELR